MNPIIFGNPHRKTINHSVLRILRAVLFLSLVTGSVSAIDALADEPSPSDLSDTLSITWVKPSDADPAVKKFDDPSVVMVSKDSSARAPLAVFLPGTTGKPANVRLLLSVIAQQGYRAIGLEYSDVPAVVQVCPRDPDPNCSSLFRRQRIYGDANGAPVSNSVEESIEHRLTKLLQYLDHLQPDDHWGDYLKGDHPDCRKS